jgi:long-chain acyl-CoA synthetase
MPSTTFHARRDPDKKALIIAETDEFITYGTLDQRCNRLSQLLRSNGISRGDHVAIFLENHIRYAEILFAALQSGVYVTPINRYLTGAEAAYIVRDCGAKAVFTSAALADAAQQMIVAGIDHCSLRLMLDGPRDGWVGYESELADQPATPIDDRSAGMIMHYSSGTTGRPKGILRPLPERPIDDSDGSPAQRPMPEVTAFASDTVYFTAAPLYHSAPSMFLSYIIVDGGTFVAMRKFDPQAALAALAKYGVSDSQWVPTMFVRMLRLPVEVRNSFDLSLHRRALLAAAPCPPEVKQAMIEWWGPILLEYYGSTELRGLSMVTAQEALAKPGTVGRAPSVHICDDSGTEVATGTIGTIWAEAEPFAFHRDPDKTRDARHPYNPNWWTCGDIGYLDADGYLFLTDRKSFMIISGGVNIYPQIIENALALHPAIEDAAVIGVPDHDLGEAVKAVLQPRPGVAGTEELANDIRAFLRERVGRHMIPRSIDFVDTLPRLLTGKLYKSKLKDSYRDHGCWIPDAMKEVPD